MLPLMLSLGLAVAAAAPAGSRCADCHFATPGAPGHVQEWDRSPHGRHDVGCERCHGGDATTFESSRAHRDLLGRSSPGSPIAPRNIPVTCGSCHSGPFVEFQKSRHYLLLRSGAPGVPTCTTCHGAVAGHLMSPRAVGAECAGCHHQDALGPGRKYAAQARELVEGIDQVRADLDRAKAVIGRVKDKARRAGLEDRYEQAEVPLTEAAQAMHAFVFDGLEERLAVARERTTALIDALANVR